MQLARTIVEERQLKEIAMQQALAQARAELQEKFVVGSVIVNDKNAYSVWSAVPPVGSDPAPVSVMDEMIDDHHTAVQLEHDSDTHVDKWSHRRRRPFKM